MIAKSVLPLLNTQIANEQHSAYLYLGMQAYCEGLQLKGLAHWFHHQEEEEHGHATRILRYLLDNDQRPVLAAIPAVATDYPSPQAAFEAALAHELRIQQQILAIADEAARQKDHTTYSFIRWFVDEQVEEVDAVRTILKQFETVGPALFLLDQALAQR